MPSCHGCTLVFPVKELHAVKTHDGKLVFSCHNCFGASGWYIPNPTVPNPANQKYPTKTEKELAEFIMLLLMVLAGLCILLGDFWIFFPPKMHHDWSKLGAKLLIEFSAVATISVLLIAIGSSIMWLRWALITPTQEDKNTISEL